MERRVCQHCFFLVAGEEDKKKWVCDQVGKKIEDIDECPEGDWYSGFFPE